MVVGVVLAAGRCGLEGAGAAAGSKAGKPSGRTGFFVHFQNPKPAIPMNPSSKAREEMEETRPPSCTDRGSKTNSTLCCPAGMRMARSA